MRVFIVIVITFLIACNHSPDAIPKPRTYPRVEFPEKIYKSFEVDYCDFRFQAPVYSKEEKDEYFFDGVPVHPCWFDLVFEVFNGRLHCSYYPVESKTQFDELVADAFEMIDKHRMRSNFIQEIPLRIRPGLSGVFFELSGPVASPYQFFLTDSTHHFLRAAIYFRNTPNPDSMRVIHEFIREDLTRMINTFHWDDETSSIQKIH